MLISKRGVIKHHENQPDTNAVFTEDGVTYNVVNFVYAYDYKKTGVFVTKFIPMQTGNRTTPMMKITVIVNGDILDCKTLYTSGTVFEPETVNKIGEKGAYREMPPTIENILQEISDAKTRLAVAMMDYPANYEGVYAS